MSKSLSLAARVHALLGDRLLWTGNMTVHDQASLFGVLLSDKLPTINVTIERDKHGMPVITADGVHHTLEDIQSDVENATNPGDDWDSDFGDACSFDYYRTFPRDESAFVGIENTVTGFAEVVVGTSLEEAQRNLARYHGYAGWDEMLSLLPSPESWTAVWTDGDPEESRKRSIEKLTAERKELVGKFDAAERLKEVDYLLDMYTAKDRHVFKEGAPYCAAIQHWRLIDGTYYTGRLDFVDVMDKSEAEALVAERAGEAISITFDPQNDDVTEEGDVPLHGTTLTWYPRKLLEEAYEAREMGAFH